MEIQFTETKGEMAGAFAVLSSQLFICGEPYGSRRNARTVVGEFRVLDFSLIECKAVPFGDDFAFAGGANDLRKLCADAIGPIEVLCDPRFVIRPPESWEKMNLIAKRSRGKRHDFRGLSFGGTPLRRLDADEVECDLRRRAFALGFAAGRGVKVKELEMREVQRAEKARGIFPKNEHAIVAARSHGWSWYWEFCDKVDAQSLATSRQGSARAMRRPIKERTK
jgi:hypothetical protein